MNSQTKNDVPELLQFLTPDERAEMDMLLAGVQEPMTIVLQIIRPDGSTQGYLRYTKDGPVELDPNDPLLKGYPPATPEQNGGYRPGGRQ